MKTPLALVALILVTDAFAEDTLTPEKWKASDEAVYLQLRMYNPPLPQEKLLGIDEVTAMIYLHGYFAGWDTGIRGASGDAPASPKILGGDTRKQKFWQSGFSDGATEAKAKRGKLLEQMHRAP